MMVQTTHIMNEREEAKFDEYLLGFYARFANLEDDFTKSKEWRNGWLQADLNINP